MVETESLNAILLRQLPLPKQRLTLVGTDTASSSTATLTRTIAYGVRLLRCPDPSIAEVQTPRRPQLASDRGVLHLTPSWWPAVRIRNLAEVQKGACSCTSGTGYDLLRWTVLLMRTSALPGEARPDKEGKPNATDSVRTGLD